MVWPGVPPATLVQLSLLTPSPALLVSLSKISYIVRGVWWWRPRHSMWHVVVASSPQLPSRAAAHAQQLKGGPACRPLWYASSVVRAVTKTLLDWRLHYSDFYSWLIFAPFCLPGRSRIPPKKNVCHHHIFSEVSIPATLSVAQIAHGQTRAQKNRQVYVMSITPPTVPR